MLCMPSGFHLVDNFYTTWKNLSPSFQSDSMNLPNVKCKGLFAGIFASAKLAFYRVSVDGPGMTSVMYLCEKLLCAQVTFKVALLMQVN